MYVVLMKPPFVPHCAVYDFSTDETAADADDDPPYSGRAEQGSPLQLAQI